MKVFGKGLGKRSIFSSPDGLFTFFMTLKMFDLYMVFLQNAKKHEITPKFFSNSEIDILKGRNLQLFTFKHLIRNTLYDRLSNS